MKFGGTSVKNPEAIRRVTGIILSRKNQTPVVVVSAMSGITNYLISLFQGEIPANEGILKLKELHRITADDLGICDNKWEESLSKAIETLRLNLTDKKDKSTELYDSIVSIGEYLSANMIAANLRKNGVSSVMTDARNLIATNSTFSNAAPDFEKSAENIQKNLIPVLKNGYIPVLQGFVGADKNGNTTTLGRGGSDYSATIIGSLINAEKVEIWSDVHGVLTADPSVVPQAKSIKHMSFSEASELAYFGAKVLHPATLLPAIEKDIPVEVLNSIHPEQEGTIISGSPHSEAGLVKSIAYKEDVTVITVTSTRMLMAYGFMAEIFNIFKKYKTPVDLVTTSEVSVSITVDCTDNIKKIKNDLEKFARVNIEKSKAIVCIVGDTLKSDHAIMGKIFGLLDDVPIHMVSQGSSEINISFVVDNCDIKKVVTTLHQYFFERNFNRKMFVHVN